MRRRWYQGNPADKFRPRPCRRDPLYSQWENLSPFEKNCWFWNTCNEFALRFRDGFCPDRVLPLRAEDLFAGSQGSTIAKIFAFIGVEPPSDNNIDIVLRSKHNKQTENEFPHPNEWTETQRRTLISIAGNTMMRLGYLQGDPAN
jgi:hypothetical protein